MQDKKIKKAISLLTYTIEYIPGEVEEFDLFKATNELVGVSSYGTTREEAIENAKLQAESELSVNTKLLESIIRF